MLFGLLLAVLSVVDPAYPVCNAVVCPERTNDLVWENDKFGMRAYGPGEYHRWSGFDVFNKNTASNVCIRWTRDVTYNRSGVSPNFHQNHGEGMDNYTMGAARGVGGIAMFADGEWKTYPDWESSRILHTGPDYCEFEMVYPAFSAAGKMTCHITLKRGERFFRNDVSFERMPPNFVVGPAMDLEPKRDHHGSLVETATSVSLFEDPKGKDGADGSTMSAVFVAPDEKVERMTDHLNCRVLGFRGRKNFTYWAGASWSLAGEITTAAAWHDCVRTFWRTPEDRLVIGQSWTFSTADGKPCVHPLLLPDGTSLSATREVDHPWHRGLWFSWKFLNGVNYWETDAEGRSEGEQRVTKSDVVWNGGAATVRLAVAWGPRREPFRPVLEEQRTISFSAPGADGGYEILWRMHFTANERTEIGRTPPSRNASGEWRGGYAGLSLRLDPTLAAVAAVATSCGATNQSEIVARERKWLNYDLTGHGGVRLEVLEAPCPTTFYHWPDLRFTNLSPVFGENLTLEKGETLDLAYRINVYSHADVYSERGCGRCYNGVAYGRVGENSDCGGRCDDSHSP